MDHQSGAGAAQVEDADVVPNGETVRRNSIRLAAAAGALALAGTVGTAGAADAASDSYTQHGVEIGANNSELNNSDAVSWICNHQSATNTYDFWIWDPVAKVDATFFFYTSFGIQSWPGPERVTLGSGEC